MAARNASVVLDRELLELVSSLVCLLEDDHVTFLNEAGARMLGLATPSEAVGRSFDEWIVADYRFLLEAGWDLLAEEEFVPLKLTRADETLFEAEMRVRAVKGQDNTFLIEARDISKFVKSAEALREREERLQGILSSVAEGIVAINDSGRIESANPAAEKMFGYDRNNKLVGRDFSDLMPAELRDRHEHFFNAYMSGLFPTMMNRTVEGMGQRANGSVFAMEISVSELRHGRHRLFTAILRDISERKEHEDRIRRLAHHDSLTGLPNRNLLNDRMNHALARVKRNGGRMAVLYVDLDRFKPINDTLGHEAGDAVLREVARRLTSCIRSSDTVARVGGDEFVVVVEEIGRSTEAALVAKKIIDTLGRPIHYGDTPCTIGASIGAAVFPDDGETMDEVCKAADIAMYRVKRAGRNAFCFFSGAGSVEECVEGE
ncbi:MAG TPA: diguanylate cyclase [Candidatus Omnitrophota bacterium]|nr:diguanylate cyclase [Candidatus Omnitrophota bacterium]